MTDSIVQSERVVLPDGMQPAAIHVRHGRIEAVAAYARTHAGGRILDAGSLVILPGLVDTHVHINDPGRADWEGFEHATRAAAAGGVTTLVDMPLNSIPPTTTADGFEAKLEAARDRCHVDVGFWGGVVPGNTSELEGLARRGVLGFKCFLSPSGVEEFGHVGEEDLRKALPVVAKLDLPLLVHAELPTLLREPDRAGDPCTYQTWLASRPPDAEQGAIDLLIRLAREYRARIHVVHLACPDALAAIEAARRSGVRITVETCPHYLTFAANEIGEGATQFKCAPPIRARDVREGLWKGLGGGLIDFIATDHSPAPPALKHVEDGDFVRAWGGIASLQIGLSAVWTGASSRGFSIPQLATWMAAAPAALAGIDRTKGSIAVGHDADLVIWDPDAECTLDATALYHRHPVTPYARMRLKGAVRQTILRGRVIYDESGIVEVPRGRPILA